MPKSKPIEYEIRNNYAVIKSTKNKEFLVDVDDLRLVKQFHWHISKNGYPVRNRDKKPLHRILINPSANQIVDHINHNKLDNRRGNLRISDYSVNGYNKRPKAGASGEPFVIYNKHNQYYNVVIDGKYVGGSYDLCKAIAIRNAELPKSKAYKYNMGVRKLI